jgi:hypothetical protein
MKRGKKPVGKIIIPSDVNIWQHEEATAKVLSGAGHVVEFIRKSERIRETTADVLIDGEKWEMKSPTSSKASSIEKNLKKASKQSDKVVFDCRRMKRTPDDAIERELKTKSLINKSLSKVKFINRHGKIIDIKG